MLPATNLKLRRQLDIMVDAKSEPFTDPGCRHNPSYNAVPPESIRHLRNTLSTLTQNDNLDTYNDNPDCGRNPSYNAVPPQSVHLRNTPSETLSNFSDSENHDHHIYDDAVVVQGNTTNGASDSNEDENVYETVDDCLVQSPPPSYDYIQSNQRSPRLNVIGSWSPPRPPPTGPIVNGDLNTLQSSEHTTNDQQLVKTIILSTCMCKNNGRPGGEHYRLSVLLTFFAIVLCQLHVLLCAIPAIVLSVKAMKFKATEDLERAKRFDKYSFWVMIPGFVLIFGGFISLLGSFSTIIGAINDNY